MIMRLFSFLIHDSINIHLFIIELFILVNSTHNVDIKIDLENIIVKYFIVYKIVTFLFPCIIASIRARRVKQNDIKILFLTLSISNFIFLNFIYLIGIDLQSPILVISLIGFHFFILKKKKRNPIKICLFIMFFVSNSLFQKQELFYPLVIFRNIISAIIISVAFVIKNKSKFNIKSISSMILTNSSRVVFAFNSSFSLIFLNDKCKKYIKKGIIPINLDLKLLLKNCILNQFSYYDSNTINKFFDLYNLEMQMIRKSNNKRYIYKLQIQNLLMLENAAKYIYSFKTNEVKTIYLIEIKKSVTKNSSWIIKENEENSLNIIRTISHELRTPINGMIGSLSLLKEIILEGCKDLLQIALVSSKLLYNNINMMIDYSLIMHKQFRPSYNFISLQAIRNRLEELFSNKAKMNNISFEILYDYYPFDFQIEYERIVQVLINLVNNSINFTSIGFVKLQIIFQNSCLSFEIRDSGIGMSKYLIDILLNNAPYSSRLKGSEFQGQYGLGIRTSNMILKLLGSELKISSNLDRGTSISFDIKLQSGQMKNNVLAQNEYLILDDKHKSRHKFNAPLVLGGTSKKDIQENKFKFPIISHNPSEQTKVMLSGFAQNIEIEKEEESDFEEENDKSIIIGNIASHTLTTCRKSLIPNNHLIKRSPPMNMSFNVSPKYLEKKNSNLSNANYEVKGVEQIILVVDDEPFNRSVLKSLIIKNFNVKVCEAKNGEKAVKKIKKYINQVILVFMDILMPIMDGYQATSEIRKFTLKFKKSIPIIALTSFPAEIEKAKCLKAGMNDFMNKPITQKQLITCFEQHISFVQRIKN